LHPRRQNPVTTDVRTPKPARNESRERKLLKNGKLCLYKSFYIPIFTCHYGGEMWIWTNADINRLGAAEMKVLRIRK
jgi:hypothetical protein